MERTRKRGKLALMLGLVTIFLMLFAACGEADSNLGSGANPTATPTEEPQSTPTPEPIEHPQGNNDVVIRIEHTGGFVPQEFLVTSMPHFSLYGDGRVITQGPQIAIYPGPALPNLQMSTLTEEGIQLILEAAKEAGLLDGDKEFHLDSVADASTTVFTITADGQTHTVSVYALGLAEDEVMNNDTIPAEEREARKKIADFQAKVLDYTGWLPAGAIDGEQTEFPLERLQIVTQPAEMHPPADESVELGEMDWPLETPLAEIGTEHEFLDQARCAVIEGEDLDTLVPALREGNQLTRWVSDGEEYALLLRPLLPGEEGCSQPQP